MNLLKEETIVKISTNYKFKKREFLHLNNNGFTIEELIPNNDNMWLEPLSSIVKYNDLIKNDLDLFVDEKDYKDETEYEGVVIETTKQTIVLGISLEKGCCEEFGSGIVFPNNLVIEDFIGKKVQKVAISLDWDWNIEKGIKFKEEGGVYYANEVDNDNHIKLNCFYKNDGGSITVRVYLDPSKDSSSKEDIIKIYVYNIYTDTGDYKHKYFLSFYDHEDEDEL